MTNEPDITTLLSPHSDDLSWDAARITAELTSLTHSTDPFAEAVRATRMPMVVTNPRLADNPLVFANNAFCRLTGYSREEILGRNCRFLQGPETSQEAVQQIHNAVSTAQPLEIDIRNHRKDGEPFWNRLLMAPVFDGNGALAYFFASQVDVTLERERLQGLETHNAALMAEVADRKRAAQESKALLAASEAKFRAITDSIDQMVWSTRPDGFHDFYNQRWYDYTGVPPGSTDGTAWNGMFHADDQARAWARWQHSLATGELYEIEYRLRHRTGIYRWVLGRAVPMRGEDGQIERWFGTCTDIQDIVEARELLARTREDLEHDIAARTRERDRTWNNSQDLLAVLDENGIFRAVNPAWTHILGWRQEELVGLHHLTLTHPDDHQASEKMRISAVSTRLPNHESRLKHRNGSYRWIAWVATSESDFVYASGRHITAEKEAAGALARTEDQLRQAQKMEAVGQLTGGIAHDFNNLLAGITGSLDLLQRRLAAGRTDGVERYAAAAITSAQRAAALTQRLLAFARRQPLDPKQVDANRLVANMEELIRRTIGPSITLEMVLSASLWPTICDPHQLDSAILNLAINARDAMPQGGRLTIETANAFLDDAYASSQGDEVKPGQYIAVSVTDTGTGMSPDIIAKAFDPFFTTKPTGQGTGLGLSMVYGFIKQSEGHVRIYSEPGQGTTFKLYLPRHRGLSMEDAGPLNPETGTAFRAEAGETVLVVDDEPTVRMLVIETLQDLGYAAIEATDGLSGLKILQSDARIDLLITDVGLPGLNGRQMAEAARTTRPDLKILFMTGYAHNAAIGNGNVLEPGMEIMSKPFALEDLAKKIRNMIEGI
jgi:PAS domain S-box-containing protein